MGKKILVVDNHPVILKFMKSLLEKEGHQVLTAEDGIRALEILKNHVPDIIFVDLIMPNISGDKLCGIIHKTPSLKNVYLVLLSAIATEEEMMNITGLKVNACIAKGPFDKMREHVLDIISRSDQETPHPFSGEIMGLEEFRTYDIARELLSVKRHFETILESLNEGILELNAAAQIVYANPVASSLFDMPEEKLLSSNFIDRFHENDRPKVGALLKQASLTPMEAIEDLPIELNGSQVELKILPLKKEDRKAVVILNDVTEKKQREARIRQAQKMEAIGTLAAGIAHDFNNLLMGIQGNTSLMILDITATHPHYDRLKNIEKQIKSGAKLTSQLLGYARKGKYSVKPLNLNDLINETSETFGRAKKEITIHLALADDLFEIQADRGQLEQVLLNLYVNAANAMPEGGGLALKTRNTVSDEIKGKLYQPKPGNYVLLTVSDTGIGMEPETLPRIFDPFFTTQQIGKGSGLGLASVYGIVKGHGGYIDVESEKNKGTTFNIYFPAQGPAEKKINEKIPDETYRCRGKKIILVVDDEEVTLDVAQDMLKALDYEVLSAKSGNAAIEIYEKNQDRIDLVILDMVMPDMGGGQVFDRMKAINSNVKVLLSSGYSMNGEASKIIERGCNGFIQKPFTMNELSEGIKKIRI
ncbi:MAG TPA: response regulator [Desulfobacterales bacterium]|nr:response regulator [Desulfobacterales bacterium]